MPAKKKKDEVKRTPLKRIGKKGREWNAARKELKAECVRLGITQCEIRKIGCQRDMFLTFAHSRKRRNITTPEQLREACLCCVTCHNEIELFPEQEMGDEVRRALASRKDL